MIRFDHPLHLIYGGWALSTIARVFEFDSRELRTTLIGEDPWFVAADICKALGLSNPTMALRGLDEDEKGLSPIETPGGTQNMAVVNESGMYALIVRSDKPNAKPFRRWVTGDVLPALRRTGRYDVADRDVVERDTNQSAIPQSFAEALRLAADQHEQIEAQRARIAADAPKVAYVDNFLRSADSCLVRQLAKRIGMTEKDLRNELMDRKVIFRTPVENRWSESKQKWVAEYRYEPATKYMAWFREGDHLNAPRLFNGQVRTTLYVTPAGKVGIATLLGRLDSPHLQIEGVSA
jgi:anti-repressor protein